MTICGQIQKYWYRVDTESILVPFPQLKSSKTSPKHVSTFWGVPASFFTLHAVATRQDSCWFFRWSRRSQELCSHEKSTSQQFGFQRHIKIIQNNWDTTPSYKILAAKIHANLLMQLIFYDVVWPYLQQLWWQRVLISWPNKQTFTPCWPDGYGWLSIQLLHTSGQVMVQWNPKAGCCSWQRSSVWRGLDSYGFAATFPKLRLSAADVQFNTPGRWICWSGTYLIEWLHCKPPVRCRGWLAMVWEVTSWILMVLDHFEFKIFNHYGSMGLHPQRKDVMIFDMKGFLVDAHDTLTSGWLDRFVPLESISLGTELDNSWWDPRYPRRPAAQTHEDGQMSHGSPSFWVTELAMAQNVLIPQWWMVRYGEINKYIVKWEA